MTTHSICLHLLTNQATNFMEQVSLWMIWNLIAQKHIPHSIHVYLDEKPQTLQNDSGDQLEFGGPTAALEEVGTYGLVGRNLCVPFPIYNIERG